MKKEDFINMMRNAQAPLKKMVEMVPDDKLDWAPAENFMSVSQVLKHLSENWAFLKMMVKNEWPDMSPEQMAEAMKLENLPRCTKTEALAEMSKDLHDAIAFIENEITEEDFFSKEIAAPWGFKGPIWQGVVMARDHSTNHKMQLHLYLKLLGIPVDTHTLYGM